MGTSGADRESGAGLDGPGPTGPATGARTGMPMGAPTTPIRLLAVSTYAEIGGGEVLFVDLLTALAARGFDVTLAVLGDGPVGDRARARGLAVVDAGPVSFRHPITVLRAAARLRRTARALGADVVHASNPKAQVVAAFATAGLRVTRSVQLLDPPPPGDHYLRVVRHLTAIRCTITAESTRAWAAVLPDRPVHLVEPGVDAAGLVARAARGDAARVWREAGVAAGDERLVTVARLQRYKGVYDAVEVAGRLAATRTGATFLVVGPDEPFEPGARDALRSRIAALGLTGRVAVTGPLTDDDLAATVRDATLLVHAAHVETFGLVVVEALALGTPVVGYAAPGPAGILADGGGAVVPVGDVASLAAAVDHALDDGELRARWEHECTTVAARYGLERMADGYTALLPASLRAPRAERAT